MLGQLCTFQLLLSFYAHKFVLLLLLLLSLLLLITCNLLCMSLPKYTDWGRGRAQVECIMCAGNWEYIPAPSFPKLFAAFCNLIATYFVHFLLLFKETNNLHTQQPCLQCSCTGPDVGLIPTAYFTYFNWWHHERLPLSAPVCGTCMLQKVHFQSLRTWRFEAIKWM